MSIVVACSGRPPSPSRPSPSRPAARPSATDVLGVLDAWPVTSCMPGAAFARVRESCRAVPMPDAPARLARVRDATHSTLAQAAVDVYCDPSAGHDRARAVDILASTLVGDDPVRMAALTADRLDAVADEQGIEALGGELGPALWLVTAETTPVACVARLRAHIEAAYVHVCDTDSLRQFRDVSPECLHLGAAHCAIAEHDADALAGRGEHAGALAIYELLAFSPPRGCASSRELGYRAARAAEAAGDPVRARELVQRTHDLHGYPAIKAGSPYDRGPWRIRSRPSPATVP